MHLNMNKLHTVIFQTPGNWQSKLIITVPEMNKKVQSVKSSWDLPIEIVLTPRDGICKHIYAIKPAMDFGLNSC